MQWRRRVSAPASARTSPAAAVDVCCSFLASLAAAAANAALRPLATCLVVYGLLIIEKPPQDQALRRLCRTFGSRPFLPISMLFLFLFSFLRRPAACSGFYLLKVPHHFDNFGETERVKPHSG